MDYKFRRSAFLKHIRRRRPLSTPAGGEKDNPSMKISIKIFILLPVLALFFCGSCSSPPPLDDSAGRVDPSLPDRRVPPVLDTLGVNDQIQVRVWRNEDLDRALTVDQAGNINLPLIGTIEAQGRTPEELRLAIENGLREYIKNPQVSVNRTAMGSRRFFVLGEVNAAGSYSMTRPLTMRQALAMAGGPNTSANDEQAVLISRNKNQSVVRTVSIGVDDYDDQGRLGADQYIYDGDIMVILPSRITDVERFMSSLSVIMNPLLSTERMVIIWPEFRNVINGIEQGGATIDIN